MDVSRPITLRNVLVVKWFGTVEARARYIMVLFQLSVVSGEVQLIDD